MKSEFITWLVHPVTLSLIGVLVFVVVLLAEILQRRLSQFGNVRFQSGLVQHSLGFFHLQPDLRQLLTGNDPGLFEFFLGQAGRGREAVTQKRRQIAEIENGPDGRTGR